MTKKDIRVLCSQHAKEVIYAKFALIRTNNQIKSECDKCKNQGWEYSLRGVKLGKEIQRTQILQGKRVAQEKVRDVKA